MPEKNSYELLKTFVTKNGWPEDISLFFCSQFLKQSVIKVNSVLFAESLKKFCETTQINKELFAEFLCFLVDKNNLVNEFLPFLWKCESQWNKINKNKTEESVSCDVEVVISSSANLAIDKLNAIEKLEDSLEKLDNPEGLKFEKSDLDPVVKSFFPDKNNFVFLKDPRELNFSFHLMRNSSGIYFVVLFCRCSKTIATSKPEKLIRDRYEFFYDGKKYNLFIKFH